LYLEDASESQMPENSEIFLRDIQTKRLRLLEKTISLAGKDVEDTQTLFGYDRRLFWYGFTQLRFATHLAAFFDRKGVEKPGSIAEAMRVGEDGSYLEPWSRGRCKEDEQFGGLADAMGGNASAREAIASMTPFCEADHLAFLADPDPLKSRARRIANAYRAELAQFPGADSAYPTIRFPATLINLLRWYYWAGRTEAYRKILARLPEHENHRLTRNGLAQIAILFGDYQKALDYYRRGTFKAPNFVYALALLKNGQHKKALEHVTAFPDDQKREYFKGFLYLDLGKYEKAVEYFERELGLSKYPWSIVQLATAHALGGDLDAALTTLGKYHEDIDPFLRDYFRGVFLRCQGRFDDALEVLDGLPPLAMARYQQGITLRCMERYDTALQRFQQEDNDYPNWLAILQTVLTYQRMGENDERDRALSRLEPNHFVFSGDDQVRVREEAFPSALRSLMETERQLSLPPEKRTWRDEARAGLYKTSFISRFLHHGDYVNLY
jgi:tetratricopeptide (TPR) repeat protein